MSQLSPGLAHNSCPESAGSWIMKEHCHRLAVPICCTNWLVGGFWLFESPCYPKRKTFAPNSKAKELPSPEEDLSFWTPELLPFWVLTLSTSPSSPQPCQQYPHSLFSSGQNTLLPLATSLPEAATPLWQRLSLAKPESGSSEPSSFLILDLGLVLDLLSPVLAGFCRISLAKISPPSMSDHPGYLIKLFTLHFWYLLTLAHLQQESC